MKTKICDEMESCNCMDGQKEEANTKLFRKGTMEICMKSVKWFMLIPGFILITAFIITYFLPADVVQILWLVVTGTLLGFGVLFFLMVGLWFRKSEKQ